MLMRKFRRFKTKLINSLPKFIKGPLLRSQFSIELPKGILKEVEYKLAESVEELNAAFKLIQDAYIDSKISSNPYEEKRILKYNLLPTTLVFIAKHKGEVIGTVSHIIDSEFGLPIDSFYNIQNVRKTGKRISEISGLAISKKWRSHGAGIVVPLTLCSLKYSLDFIGIDYFYIVTNLNGKNLYENIFLFQSVNNNNKEYNFANNAEGYVQVLNTKGHVKRLRDVYKNQKSFKKNFYMIWSVNPWKKQCHFTSNGYNFTMNPSVEREQLSFANENREKFEQLLTDDEMIHFDNVYHLDQYRKKIKVHGENVLSQRRDSRYLVNTVIKFMSKHKLIEAKILDVSFRGFLMVFDSSIEIPDNLVGRIHLKNDISTSVKATITWKNGFQAGYFIQNIDFIQWMEFITFIDNEYLELESSKKAS